jgi:hypothetical protein
MQMHTNKKGGRMKTEHEYGFEYAEAMQGEEGFDKPVDIEKMLTASSDIPNDDYRAMKQAGIENPDAREYWEGFNSFFA